MVARIQKQVVDFSYTYLDSVYKVQLAVAEVMIASPPDVGCNIVPVA